jgi:hypothetical protein
MAGKVKETLVNDDTPNGRIVLSLGELSRESLSGKLILEHPNTSHTTGNIQINTIRGKILRETSGELLVGHKDLLSLKSRGNGEGLNGWRMHWISLILQLEEEEE